MARRGPEITLSEVAGVRSLHFGGSEWIQGSMRLSRPDHLELEYAQQMMSWLLFLAPDAQFHITQLGLGTGALTKFCHARCAPATVAAVEINPTVITVARTMFYLPEDEQRLRVIGQDAWAYVRDGAQHASANILQLDLYDATAEGPVLDSLPFYRACRKVLRDPGVLTVNLFGQHASFEPNIRRLRQAFSNRVLQMPLVHDGNVVAIALNGPPLHVTRAQMLARAKVVKQTTGLPALKWVTDLWSANALGAELHI
ncbi:MAG: spermidine synthase [Ottowia sp.]|nr:spermidine synthase [Ottowia sp.]